MRPTLNPALREFWSPPARNRVLYGGRDSSKSWDAAGNAIALAQWTKVRTMATRQFQNRIDDSVYTLLKIQIDRFGLNKKFAIYNNRIECPETGADFLFYGRARNIDDIKGTEGVDIHWAEECHLMTQAEWLIIDPTMRKEGSEHWIIFNPRFKKDFVFQNFVVNPPPDTIVRLINYDENPFLSNTSRKIIEHMRDTDQELFSHIYGGQPMGDDERVIIKSTWIEAAINAHIKLGFSIDGPDRIGFDVADDGDDRCANIHAKGSVALWGEEWKGREDELLKSCSRTYHNAEERNAHIYYDCIGVGAMAGAKFDEINQANSTKLKYSKFNAGGAVENPDSYYSREGGKITNKDFFCNIKAQVWWSVADRFRNTYDAILNGTKYAPDQMISISSAMPQLEKLKDELSTPMRDFDQNGKVKVESKKDLAKRDVKSPNLADAFVMCFTPKRPGGFFGA
jgi:phage terminase large subunit